MISTICNEIIYPYDNFRVCNLGDDYLCVHLPSFISKTLGKASSFHQLHLLGSKIFGSVAQDNDVDLGIAINRSLGELSTDHRFLTDSSSHQIRGYIEKNKSSTILYNNILGCYESTNLDSDFMTKTSIEIVKNTNSFVLLMNPNRIVCHRKILPSLGKVFCNNSFNYVDEDIVAHQIINGLTIHKETESAVFSYSDVISAVKKVIEYRKRTISFINEFDSESDWAKNTSLLTNSKMLIFKLKVDGELVYIHLNTLNMKATCLGMGRSYRVKELIREYRDYVRYNGVYFNNIT